MKHKNTLQHLFQNRVNEKAIMSIHQIVTEFGYIKLRLEPTYENNINLGKKGKGADNSNSNDNISNRTEYRNSFVDSLRESGNKNSAIKRQRETREKTKTEIVGMEKNINETSAQCQTLISFINTLTKQVY